MPAEPVTVPLTTPIQAHGETLTELKIRPPNAADCIACGNPVKVGPNEAQDGVDFNMDPATIGKMLPRLTGIPPSSVGQLSLLDFYTCQAAVMGFMQPPAASAPERLQSSTDTSTSPGPGSHPPIVSLRSAGMS